jgi:hypothetical protein
MAKRDYKKGGIPFTFAALPMDVIRSEQWQALSHGARALAIDLMAQYTGKNNGRLCPSFEAMERHGWKSKHTLIAAKRALLECPFVVLTRKGHPPRTADWIAFTWWPLNWEPSMDIGPKSLPYLNFVRVERRDPNTGRALSEVQKLHHKPQKTAPGGAETAPHKAAA